MSKLNEKVKAACEKDPRIVTDLENIKDHPGRTEAQLNNLGLTSSDLKRLERAGLAFRGYQPTRKGQELRWVLLGEPVPVVKPEATNLTQTDKQLYALEKLKQAMARRAKNERIKE